MVSIYREMCAVLSVTLLGLMSVSLSAPLTCEQLVRPLDVLEPHHILGRWALVASSSPPPSGLNDLQREGSMTMYFSNSSEPSVYSFTQFLRLDDQCNNVSYKFTIERSVFTSKLDEVDSITWSFLYTSCPDCMVVHYVLERENRTKPETSLYSKRRQLEEREIEEFRAQVECLNMPPIAVMDPTKELCPKETTSDAAAQTADRTEGHQAE